MVFPCWIIHLHILFTHTHEHLCHEDKQTSAMLLDQLNAKHQFISPQVFIKKICSFFISEAEKPFSTQRKVISGECVSFLKFSDMLRKKNIIFQKSVSLLSFSESCRMMFCTHHFLWTFVFYFFLPKKLWCICFNLDG